MDPYTYKLLNDLDSSSYASSSAGATGIWGIIALILAIVGGILLYFLFVKAKSEPKGKFWTWLKRFLDFKTLWIEPIMKVTYYILTIFAVLMSFSFLGSIGYLGGYGFLMFLMALIGLPVLIRIGYEMTMMFIMIWRNTRDIAENTKKK